MSVYTQQRMRGEWVQIGQVTTTPRTIIFARDSDDETSPVFYKTDDDTMVELYDDTGHHMTVGDAKDIMYLRFRTEDGHVDFDRCEALIGVIKPLDLGDPG